MIRKKNLDVFDSSRHPEWLCLNDGVLTQSISTNE